MTDLMITVSADSVMLGLVSSIFFSFAVGVGVGVKMKLD